MIKLLPYRFRYPAVVLGYCLIENRCQKGGIAGAIACVRMVAANWHNFGGKPLAPRGYCVEWHDIHDAATLRRRVHDFVHLACTTAPRPYGDGRFSLYLLKGEGGTEEDLFDGDSGDMRWVEFHFRDLLEILQDIEEKWFTGWCEEDPVWQPEWAGQRFSCCIYPHGANRYQVPLRPLPGLPNGGIWQAEDVLGNTDSPGT